MWPSPCCLVPDSRDHPVCQSNHIHGVRNIVWSRRKLRHGGWRPELRRIRRALYGHAGFYSDFDLGSRFILSPSISVGAYHDGDGKDLGGVIEFRSAIELAHRFYNKSRLGLQFGHLSNAHIYDSNPGEEFLIVNYLIPITSIGKETIPAPSLHFLQND